MKTSISQTLWLAAAVWAAAAPALAQAEGAVRGAVLAAADGSALEGAEVKLDGGLGRQALTATTGASGTFLFAHLPPGDYVLTVGRRDFERQQYRLTLRPREVYVQTVALELAGVRQSIDVEAKLAPSTHSPGSTVVSWERLDLLPLPQRSNLPDAIVISAPGMIRGHDDFVHVRGQEIALNTFINGVSFWENPHLVFSPGLGADYIDSINVMTGGFSAEYGNRFGGILDVVTKSGLRMRGHGSVSLGIGSALRHNAAVEYGGRQGSFGYYLNAAGFESARFLSPPETISLHNTGRAARSFAQLDYAASEKHSLRLSLAGDGANFQLPKTLLDAQYRPNFNNDQRTRSQSAIASWDYTPSADTVLHTSFYQRYSRVRMIPNADQYGAKLDAERTLQTYGVKSDWTRFFGRHNLKSGVDLVLLRPDENVNYLSQPWINFTHLPEINQEHIHFRGPNLGPGLPRPVLFEQRKTGGQASVYVQDKFRWTRRLTIDIGLRYDHFSLAATQGHVSPRLNVAYQFTSGTLLHGSFNHFFVPPPVENVLASSAGLTRFISEVGVALPPLRPIVENQFEGGVRQPLPGGLRAGLTAYYRISNNPLHTTLFPDARYYAYANFDKGTAYGMEVRLDLPASSRGFSGYLNYALARVWFYNPVTAGFITEVAHLRDTHKFLAPMDQTHTLSAGLTYRHRPSRLWSFLALEYGSGTPGTHSGGHEHESEDAHEHASVAGACGVRCPDHFTQNLTIGWDALTSNDQPRLTLQFNVENLTDNVYLISKESTFTQGQYSIPRLISGSLRIRF